MKRLTVISTILLISMLSCSTNDGSRTHPWASFPAGSWVEIHTYHRMTMAEQEEPSVWESDSRITVINTEKDRVTLGHDIPSMNIQEEALLPVPATDIFPGARALGQWPHDIFPIGPERQSGMTPEDKNPFPENMNLKVLEENIVISLEGENYKTTLFLKEWDISTGTGKRHYTMKAWVADGIELPLKWIITSSDGTDDSETELVALQDMVKIDEKELPCLMSVTRKKLGDGVIVKKRWSSSKVPGFMVKMESQFEGNGFTLEVQEWITDFLAL